MPKKIKKQMTVAVSGGFDPLHIGHVRMFREAKKLGTKLVVIVNNDNWLLRKKGYIFMPQEERVEIIKAIEGVDDVIMTAHGPNPSDMSVSKELAEIRPDIFANGGDRKIGSVPEIDVCRKIGCLTVYNVGQGGKVQSSSWLVGKVKNGK